LGAREAVSSAILSGDCLHLKNLREPTAFHFLRFGGSG